MIGYGAGIEPLAYGRVGVGLEKRMPMFLSVHPNEKIRDQFHEYMHTSLGKGSFMPAHQPYDSPGGSWRIGRRVIHLSAWKVTSGKAAEIEYAASLSLWHHPCGRRD
jgi:hypothetical protein